MKLLFGMQASFNPIKRTVKMNLGSTPTSLSNLNKKEKTAGCRFVVDNFFSNQFSSYQT
jgi:hypothetical protein